MKPWSGSGVTPPVLWAPRVSEAFKLYIATQERVIGAALTQEGGVEFAMV
jgi:hypothetical protein